MGFLRRDSGGGASENRQELNAQPIATAEEDPVVRQYRYLLRTAPADALEAAHLEALQLTHRSVRAEVLRSIQERLVAGLRLSPDNLAAIAHLAVLGERRVPGSLLRHYDALALQRLASAVLASEAAFGLLNGYAGWDGAEPEAPDDTAPEDGFGEKWREARNVHVNYKGWSGGPSSPDTWGNQGP